MENNFDKIKKLRKKNNILWIKLLKLASQNERSEDIIKEMKEIEKDITNAAKNICNAQNINHAINLLNPLKRLREINNQYWITLFGFAMEKDFEKAKNIMGQIIENDQDEGIQALSEKK